ncbi:ABC transporter substrate-binding protein [Amycolatopsis taiwanensis]|uniref:Branched-chain amino acid ABC transporter substrate-binding protein n=1 Tax=Amycolatopsis taiwanensis TaxID=342230 RepID=A0A9W6RC31_9PSEU|nr:ABC transporter substrate-binding protein [Amycolatopsis taiwanensis]GLY71307.1 branched-chain amino acid ABC transporter substrate-binding protein [Amycolatopsis taiwanensis]
MRGRVLMAVAAALGVAMVLAGCGKASGGSGGKDEPYRVLVTGGVSSAGVLGANAKTSINAAQAGADVVNRMGGVAGRKVEVTVVDDGGDATTAVTKLREAIAKQKPDLFLNSGPSQITAATLPILKQNKILSFNISPVEGSSEPSKYPLNFDLGTSSTDIASGIASFAKDQGYHTVGVVRSSTSYGKEFDNAVKTVFPEYGLSIVDDEQYDSAALDMTPQLETIQSHHPDALVIDAYGPAVGYLLKGVDKLGWNVPIISDDAVSATGLVSTPEPAGLLGTPLVRNLHLEMQASAVYDAGDSRVKQLVEAMTAIAPIPSTLINAQNYDALPLIAAAAKKVGSADDAGALAKALEDPAVQKDAATAIWTAHNYTAESHASNVGAAGFRFIKPSAVKDGQFHPEG